MAESRSEDILAVTLGLESSEVLVPPESRIEDYLQQLLEKMQHLDGKTAYEYAVEKGYTGTEEQFASMMASYATVAEEATDAAGRAIAAAEEVEDAVEDIAELKSQIGVLEPAATTSDVGKMLKVKSVSSGKVTEYEFGEGGGGTSDYSDLSNKPQINSVTLSGNKSLSDLGIASASKVAAMNPAATNDDIGKALSPKTVSNGEVTEWQYVGEAETHDDVTYETGGEYGYYRYYNGAIEEKSSSTYTRSKITVESWMQSVAFSINSVTGMDTGRTIYCAFADGNDAFISRATVAVGSYNLPVPSNAAYIYLNFFTSAYNSAYKIISNAKGESESAYDGMDGVAFGTSLTYKAITDYGYLQHLPTLSGITFDNQGIGSSTILGDGGNLDMLAAIKAYSSYSGKEVCILEGFVNDWFQNKTLGTWKDIAETTVCGCVRSALNFIMTQNANITLFLVLDPYGRNYNSVDCSSTATNSASLTQYEYYEEIAKVAESLGIPVIKEYAGSQISEKTPQYIADNIHPTSLGAEQSANFIWDGMRQRTPNAVPVS